MDAEAVGGQVQHGRATAQARQPYADEVQQHLRVDLPAGALPDQVGSLPRIFAPSTLTRRLRVSSFGTTARCTILDQV
ncbi:hypothetical protein U9R90_31410 [Streptomyces sp. E11-3]|uniref:hypothetical protein n=1 Tax=Streptomyces sp. E11-3 TaxID=3110112 RepID=UPI00397EA14F